MRGFVPQWITNQIAIPRQTAAPLTLQRYFQQILPLGACVEEDGQVVGHMIMDAAQQEKSSDLEAAIRMFVSSTAMLRDCGVLHVGTLLVAGITSKVSPSLCDTTPLESLEFYSEDQASALGRAFSAAIMNGQDNGGC